MSLVSVIVPVYNVEKYIIKCLESIKSQTLDDFECLIIDDGSKDSSIKLAEEYIKDDKRFVIHHKENGGLSDARNFGINIAKGEYISFIDSDDYLDERLLELSYEMAKKHNSDICTFDMYYVWQDGSKSVSLGGKLECSSYKENNDLLFINNSANNKIYRNSFMKDKRFIKGMWYEDLATIPVLIAKANNISYVNEPLYYYVQREGSISHNASEKIFDIYAALKNVEDKLNITSDKLIDLYLDNCLDMTTLRIRNIDDVRIRKSFYLKNIELLDRQCPMWYESLKNKDYEFKKKIVFFLLKHKMINLLDKVY